jgi:hypothetical protein
VQKLTPLKRLKKLSICVFGNPFEKKEGWKSSLANLGLKL